MRKRSIITVLVIFGIVITSLQALSTAQCLDADGNPGLFTCEWVFVNSIIPKVFAEPESLEDRMKWYRPLIDKTLEDKLPPKKQFEIGITMADTFCFDDKIRILKLSESNLVACVTSNTLEKLVQRGWGITQYDPDKVQNTHAIECGITWKFTFEKETPSESSFVKTMKLLMLDYSELILWQPMEIIHLDNMLEIHWNGNFRQQEILDIHNSLKSSYASITNIDTIPRGCI
jgi:hypothetical protein